MNQIHHYTVNTGDGRLTDRREVRDDVIALLRPLCEAGGGDLPGGLRFAVTRGESGGYVYTIYARLRTPQGTQEGPVVTCGLALDDEQAAEVWPALHTLAEQSQVPRPNRPPRVPWLSVVLLSTLSLLVMAGDRAIVEAIGDLERCIAWTLIEMEK